MQFLANNGVIAGHIPYALASPLHAKSIGYAVRHYSTNTFKFETIGIQPGVYWKRANDFIEVLRKKYHHNEDATRNNYLVYYQMFYVFICEFSLPYPFALTGKNRAVWTQKMEISPKIKKEALPKQSVKSYRIPWPQCMH